MTPAVVQGSCSCKASDLWKLTGTGGTTFPSTDRRAPRHMAPGGHEPGHSVPLQQSGIGPADTVARDQFSDDQFDGDYPLTTSRSQNYLK